MFLLLHGIITHVGKWREEFKTPEHIRFWSKVRKGPKCWEWLGSTNNKRYGIFVHKEGRLAHRYSFFLDNKSKRTDVAILHSCDNSLCVRPNHLRAGTQSENMRDILLRGHANGKPHGRSRLTPDDVRAIRGRLKSGLTDLQEIAADYGITKGAVCHIKYGVTWAWLH